MNTLPDTDAVKVGRGGDSPLGRMFQHPNHYQKELGEVIRVEKPQIMIETGVESGYSTEHFLVAMDDVKTGHLYSCDPAPSGFYNTYPIVHPRFTFIKEASWMALDKIFKETGRLDLFLHDSDHSWECQTFEYEWAWNHVHSGGIIATDDPGWGITVEVGGSIAHHAWDAFCERHKVTPLRVKINNGELFKKP
jgi:predicted O-methyltransferase YrrM